MQEPSKIYQRAVGRSLILGDLDAIKMVLWLWVINGIVYKAVSFVISDKDVNCWGIYHFYCLCRIMHIFNMWHAILKKKETSHLFAKKTLWETDLYSQSRESIHLWMRRQWNKNIQTLQPVTKTEALTERRTESDSKSSLSCSQPGKKILQGEVGQQPVVSRAGLDIGWRDEFELILCHSWSPPLSSLAANFPDCLLSLLLMCHV